MIGKRPHGDQAGCANIHSDLCSGQYGGNQFASDFRSHIIQRVNLQSSRFTELNGFEITN